MDDSALDRGGEIVHETETAALELYSRQIKVAPRAYDTARKLLLNVAFFMS